MTEGELLRVEGKAQRKPIELIKVLVALGRNDVPADKLIDILARAIGWRWPKSVGYYRSSRAQAARFRRSGESNGSPRIVEPANGLGGRLGFGAQARSAHPAANTAKPDIALLEAAAPQVLNLYRGHFLTGETEEPWQIPVRNRLAGRFQRFVLRLGERWETNEAWVRAADLYQRAIELDPLAGNVLSKTHAVCLRAQGQRAEAMEVFRRCRQTLSVVLGVAPSTETEAVFRQLHDAWRFALLGEQAYGP